MQCVFFYESHRIDRSFGNGFKLGLTGFVLHRGRMYSVFRKVQICRFEFRSDGVSGKSERLFLYMSFGAG